MDGTDAETPGQTAPSRAESLSAHAESSISEDALLAAARERAVEIGAGAVTPAVGALLSLLTKLSGGKAVAEVGTGAGVSGLWLLSGMSDDGVLTTIDIEPEYLPADALEAKLKSEIVNWTKFIDAKGIKAE